MIIFIFIIVVVILGILGFWYCDYSTDIRILKENGYTQIKFSSFKDYFVLNPVDWECRSNCVLRRRGNCDNLKFYFNFFNYLRYTIWAKALQKRKEHQNYTEKSNKQQIALLELVKKDIEKVKAQSDSEIDKAKAIVYEVAERIS